MDLKTLINKTVSGVKFILAQPTMMFRNKEVVPIIATHIVKEDEVGRPDLISLEYYNTDSKTDIILKWNGISDPFSLRPGEVLEIPTDEVPFYKLDRPSKFEDNKIKNEFVQGKKLSQKDKNRLDALKKKYNKDVLLPPNVIAVGKKNFKFTPGGTVILGAQAQNDAVTQSIISDLAGLSGGEGNNSDAEGLASGSGGAGGIGSGSGSGNGGGSGNGLTESQLDKNLANQAGRGGRGGANAGGSGGSGAGSGAGSADGSGGTAGDGTSPESSGGANDIANDGAPCN